MTMTEKNSGATVDGQPEAPAVDGQPEASTALEKREERRMRRWDPFEMFDALQEEMARFWGHAFPLMPRPLSWPLRRMALAPTTWMPSIDVYKKDGNLVVKAELPGVRKEDIEVTLDQGDLVIRGERTAERETREENYYRMERSFGSFYRHIPLPFDAKPDQITASYNDGVLEIRIPRPTQEEQQSQPRRIPLR
jgi:HSP20 family protein